MYIIIRCWKRKTSSFVTFSLSLKNTFPLLSRLMEFSGCVTNYMYFSSWRDIFGIEFHTFPEEHLASFYTGRSDTSPNVHPTALSISPGYFPNFIRFQTTTTRSTQPQNPSNYLRLARRDQRRNIKCSELQVVPPFNQAELQQAPQLDRT